MDSITVDFSEPLSKKEHAKLLTRRARLTAMEESVRQATSSMRKLAARREIAEVQVRYAFVSMTAADRRPRSTPLRGGGSDRRLPDDEDRPPDARLMSPRGAALRFFLTALFEAQAGTNPGQRPRNKRPLRADTHEVVGWTDLLASGAVASRSGKNYITADDKKARQVRNALDRLVKEELVALTRENADSTKADAEYEQFLLLHEGGRREQGPNLPYHAPLREPAFPIPVTLFTNGWIHVLEDTELMFILMMAACHRDMGGRQVRIPSETRLLRFGIGRDAYEAHMMLSQLGLVTVVPDPSRYPDGKVREFNSGEQALPHTLGFVPVGF